MSKDADMLDVDLEEEFRKLCGGHPEPEILQETVRCQRSELEELREAKRQLEQREVELQQLRAAMDTQGAPRIVGTEEKNSGEPPRRATSDGAAGWPASDPAGPWSRTENVRNDRNREAVDSGSEALENCGRPEKEGRGCIGLIKAQKWADVEDPRGVVMVVPLALRALKRLRGFRNTTVFYYRSFWDINPGRTMLFEGRARHVILVFPSGNAGIGAWSPLVDAVGMWMAGGATIYLVAGPRPIADAAWAEVAELARKQIDTYIRPEYRGKIVDKFPLRGATVDWKAPCFALGIVEDTEGVLSERQARVFYAACAQQLEPCLQMEPLPNKDHGVGIGLVGHSDESWSRVKEGRVGKERGWRGRTSRQRHRFHD